MDQVIEKVWDKDSVKALIARSDTALAEAVLRIFARQTEAEKASHATLEHNNRGFTGVDAPFLSDIAKKLPLYGNRMTIRQLARVRPMMLKYWRQLLEEIEAKGGKVDYRAAKSRKVETANAPIREKAPSLVGESANPMTGSW